MCIRDRVYVKIIDYKTGNTSLDLVALYYGLQLQLAVYLDAAVELEQKKHPGKQVEPAGVFYYHIDDPMLDQEEDETDEAWGRRKMCIRDRRKAVQCSRCALSRRASRHCAEKVSAELQRIL